MKTANKMFNNLIAFGLTLGTFLTIVSPAFASGTPYTPYDPYVPHIPVPTFMVGNITEILTIGGLILYVGGLLFIGYSKWLKTKIEAV